MNDPMTQKIQATVISTLEELGIPKHLHVHRPSVKGIGLVVSVLTNLALLGGLVNTYFRNAYFRLWADGAMASILNGAIVFGIILGLVVHCIFLHDKLKNSGARKERTEER